MKPHEEAHDEAQIFLQAKYVSSRVLYLFAANILLLKYLGANASIPARQ